MDFTCTSRPQGTGNVRNWFIMLTLFSAVPCGFSMATTSCKMYDPSFSCELGTFIFAEERSGGCRNLTCKQCGTCGLGTNKFLNYMQQACQKDKDTVCCHTVEQIVVDGKCQKPTPATTLPTSAKENTTPTRAATGQPLAVAGIKAATSTNSSRVPRLHHVTWVLTFIVFLVF